MDFLLWLLVYQFLCSVHLLRWNHKHDNNEIVQELLELQKKCPSIIRVYYLRYGDFSYTVMGHKLYVIAIGKHPTHHVPGTPEFGIINNLHGNEIIGREIALHLTNFLCYKFLAKEAKYVDLIYSLRMHILVSMNPDGYELRSDFFGYGEGHNNLFYQDLNHDFPDLGTAFFKKMEKLKHNVSDHLFTTDKFLAKQYQRETLMVMNWILTLPFVLQLNIHSASLTFNYGYQQGVDDFKHAYNESPDDELYRYIAFQFVGRHVEMRNWRKRCSTYWVWQPYAVQRGSTWLSVKNGWHDFTYLSTNTIGNNVFLSCQRNMLAENIRLHFYNSLPSILFYIKQVHMGFKGIVYDEDGYVVPEAVMATINITDYEKPYVMMRFHVTAQYGDYYKMVLPGNYAVYVRAEGYYPSLSCIKIDDSHNQRYSAKLLTIELKRSRTTVDENCYLYGLTREVVNEIFDLKV